MRIVSLVPAATEMVHALGATADLAAVTHDDDYPPTVRALPRITRSTIPHGASAREIDNYVREAGARGESTFHLDADALRDARPDVILGQTLCAVCAVTLDQVPRDLAREPHVVPLHASTLEGMLDDLRRVADAIGRDPAPVIRELRARLSATADRVAGHPAPRVACLEWLDPLFNAGHWVPEQVRIAGGEDVLGIGDVGERSREITWGDVIAARPDIVIAMPCGWDAARAAREAEALGPISGARVLGVDGAAYFSRPGPRLVDGVALLASIFHPGAVDAPDGAMAVSV